MGLVTVVGTSDTEFMGNVQEYLMCKTYLMFLSLIYVEVSSTCTLCDSIEDLKPLVPRGPLKKF